MEDFLGTGIVTFLLMTFVLFGGAAFQAGQAFAAQWKPWWNMVVAAVFLALAERFLTYALFDGELLSIGGFIVTAVLLAAIGLAAYRLTLASRMVSQYPWLYERTSLFSWREKASSDA